jgi:superfamily II DNA or RNA helicase
MLNGMLKQKVRRSVTLHPYQNDFVRSVEASWADGNKRVLAVAPVGSGKTVMAGELIAREVEKGGRVLVAAHTIDLVAQFKQSLEDNYGLWVTMDGGGESSEDSPVVCTTVQSAASRLGKKWGKDDMALTVVDEAHRIHGSQHKRCLEFFDCKNLSITATPVRSDQKDLMSVLDHKAFDIPITDLIRDGYLSNIVIQNIPIEFDLESDAVTGDYKDEEVGAAVAPMLEPCARAYAQHAQGKCGAIFLPLVSLSEKFCGLLNDLGIRAIHVDGSLSPRERQEAKRKVEMGEAECFCCSLLWSEGFDLRPLNLLMNLRASKSWTLQTQIIGRITRVFSPEIHGPKGTKWPKKTEATILDPLWHTDTYNMLQRPASFIAKDAEELESIERHLKKKQQRGEKADLMWARAEAMAEKEEKIRQRLEAMKNRKARTVDACEFFLAIHLPDLAEWQPMSKSDMLPITQAQSDCLIKNGFAIESVLGKGHASAIIDHLKKERWSKDMATLKQLKYCIALGCPEDQAWQLSFKEASDFISAHAKPKPSYYRK